MDKTLYCWSCGQASHAKKDCPSKQRQAQTVGNPKRTPVVLAKDSTKGACNRLSKQLRCSHCGHNNHLVDNCFALHPEKRPTLEREKTLEAKIGALEERFRSLASSSGAQVSSSTPNYYMFGASGEVVSSAALSQVTPSTTEESVTSLRIRDNVPTDQIG